MGQQEVYDFLKKNRKKWFNTKKITEGLNVSIGSVTNCLKKLRKSRYVDYRQSGNRNEFEYRFKG